MYKHPDEKRLAISEKVVFSAMGVVIITRCFGGRFTRKHVDFGLCLSLATNTMLSE